MRGGALYRQYADWYPSILVERALIGGISTHLYDTCNNIICLMEEDEALNWISFVLIF